MVHPRLSGVLLLLGILTFVAVIPSLAFSQESTEVAAAETPAPAPVGPPSNADLKVMMDTAWVMITAFLVFFMNLGFACVESGFCRHKNCVNILSKNFMVFAVTTIGFWVLGWGLMFGNGTPMSAKKGLLMLQGADNSPAIADAYAGDYKAISWTGVPLAAKFFFQLVFAGTAATIVSGAVAERIKYLSFILFSFIMAIAIYPIVGHWIWGGGWLSERGFVDFAGSTRSALGGRLGRSGRRVHPWDRGSASIRTAKSTPFRGTT